MKDMLLKIKSNKKISYAIAAGTLLIVVFSIIYLFKFSKAKDVVAIDFSKLKKDEIIQWVEKSSLKKSQVILKYEFSESVAIDNLISQSIKPNEVIKDKIELVISKGYNPELEIEIPSNYKEMSKQIISKWFSENHFTNIIFQYKEDDKIAKDMVLSINKTSKQKRNSEIVVIISNGKLDPNAKEIEIPDFSSYTMNEFIRWCNNNGFEYDFQYVYGDSSTAGKIVRQYPLKNTKAKQGSVIVVTISNGKAIVLSDLIGKDEDYINDYVSENNLEVEYIYSFSENNEKGTCFKQIPEKNSQVAEGDTIEIYISLGSENITPNGFNYVGKTLDEFKGAIKKIADSNHTKINVVNTNPIYSDNIETGKIVKHDTIVRYNKDVSYTLSLGKYTEKNSASNFNGHDRSYINNVINDANSLNAGVSFKEVIDNTTSSDNNNSFDCIWENKILVCKFHKIRSNKGYINAINYDVCSGRTSCDIKIKNVDNDGEISLTINVQDGGYSDSYPKDSIIVEKQNPSAGSLVSDGSSVTIFRSKGKEPVVEKQKAKFSITSIKAFIQSENIAPDADIEKRRSRYEFVKQKIKETYSNFTNVTVKPMVDNAKPVGTILNDDIYRYNGKEIDIDTPLNFVISIGESME